MNLSQLVTIVIFFGVYIVFYRYKEMTRNSANCKCPPKLSHTTNIPVISTNSLKKFNYSTFEEYLQLAILKSPDHFPKSVVLVEVNYGFLKMAHNFLLHIRSVQPPMLNVVMVALDDKTCQNLQTLHELTYCDKTHVFETSSMEFRSDGYNTIVGNKWKLLNDALKTKVTVLMCDVDVIFLRNPFNFFVDIPSTCDFAAATDALPPNVLEINDFRFSESGQGVQFWINTGLMLWSNSSMSKSIVSEFLDPSNRIAKMDDQYEFNEYLKSKSKDQSIKMDDWFTRRHKCFSIGGLKTYILSPFLFGSQRHMIDFSLPDTGYLTPYAVHFNWISGVEPKMSKMKTFGFWLVEN